jgi:hypothetical protein
MSTKVYETTTKTATAIEFVVDVLLRGNCFLFHLLRYCTEVNNVNNITA